MTLSPKDLKAVERALLEHPLVEDCVVLAREPILEPEGRQCVAYVVSSGRLPLDSLKSHLEELLPEGPRPGFFVPLSRVPVLESGAVDERALQSLQVITDELRKRWEEALHSLPAVKDAAVIVEEAGELARELRLPGWLLSLDKDEAEASAPPAAVAEAEPRRPPEQPAVSHGGPLRDDLTTVSTLPEILCRAAAEAGDRGLVHILADGAEVRQSYGELLEEARRILSGLRDAGLKPGDNVILHLKESREFLPAFWACVLGGGVPVPVAIAPMYDSANAAVMKLRNAWDLLGQPLVLTNRALLAAVSGVAALLDLRDFRVHAVDDLADNEAATELHAGAPEDLALMVLTSGSTGMPKSVMLSHGNLVRRSAGAVQLNGFSKDEVTLNWMALDHVAGLVYYHLRDVFLGCRQVHGPTEAVLQDPLKWLDWIDRYRVTVTFAPNFAFGLVNDQAADIAHGRWDLSCLEHAQNAGEAIVSRTARRFLSLLEGHGLPATAMRPAWGMSETCSAVTCSDQFTLETTGDDDSFVNLGAPIPGFAVRIVDDKDQVLAEEAIGSVQVKGLPVTSGYYKNPGRTAESFTADGWFKTGDLGYLKNGYFTFTGRDKNDIVINGINYFSHEIESVIESIEGVETSYTAATAVREKGAETDRLAVFFHPAVSEDQERAALIKEVRRQVLQRIGISASYVVPLEKEDVPKTNIGKIQRSRLGQALLDGEFDGILARLSGGSDPDILPSWFFEKAWRRRQGTPAPSPGGTVLIFAEAQGLGGEIARQLGERGEQGVRVETGPVFTRIDSGRYRLRPGEADDYRLLFEALRKDGIAIDRVLHLWTYGPGGEPNADAFEEAQEHGLYSLLCLAQSLSSSRGGQERTSLVVVSSGTQRVRETDDVDCNRAPLLGFLKTIRQEMPWLRCRHLDLPCESPPAEAALVLRELGTAGGEREVAYRDGDRWVECLHRVEPGGGDATELPLKRGGAYLISGGLGGIGCELARHLLERWGARLLLVGRRPLPSGDDERRGSLERLSELARGRGEVVYEAVDISASRALQDIVAGAEKRWGQPLDGVFQLAGHFGERLVTEETRETLAETLRPKVHGTWNLHELVRDRADTLFVSFSSVNGFFGGYGVGAYSAANAFLDSFVHHQRSRGMAHSHCLAWSLWDEVGMSRGYEMKELSRTKGYYAIAAERGIQSLLLALREGLQHVLIGVEGSNWNVRRFVDSEWAPARELAAYVSLQPGSTLDSVAPPEIVDVFGSKSSCVLHGAGERPGESGTEASPAAGTELENRVASVWKEVLKVKTVGTEDNFFDLGGDSLKVVQLTKKLSDVCGVSLSMTDIFRCPTVRALAHHLGGIEDKEAKQEIGRSRGRGEQRRARAVRRRRKT